jgi:hypothetical protein
VGVAMWSAGANFQERTAEARGQTRLLEAISKALEGRVGPAGAPDRPGWLAALLGAAAMMP